MRKSEDTAKKNMVAFFQRNDSFIVVRETSINVFVFLKNRVSMCYHQRSFLPSIEGADNRALSLNLASKIFHLFGFF